MVLCSIATTHDTARSRRTQHCAIQGHRRLVHPIETTPIDAKPRKSSRRQKSASLRTDHARPNLRRSQRPISWAKNCFSIGCSMQRTCASGAIDSKPRKPSRRQKSASLRTDDARPNLRRSQGPISGPKTSSSIGASMQSSCSNANIKFPNAAPKPISRPKPFADSREHARLRRFSFSSQFPQRHAPRQTQTPKTKLQPCRTHARHHQDDCSTRSASRIPTHPIVDTRQIDSRRTKTHIVWAGAVPTGIEISKAIERRIEEKCPRIR